MIAILVLALLAQSADEGPVVTALPDAPAAAAPAPAPPSSPPAPPPAAPPSPPFAPVAAAPAVNEPPRKIDDLSRPLGGAVPQGLYEAGVRGAFSRNQSRQGPLDGTWLLKDAGGASLYRLQLVDRGLGGPPIEGAWSDLSGGTGAGPSGFLTGATRDGPRLVVQFAPPGTGIAEAVLEQRPDGAFSGELRAGAAVGRPVTLARP